MIDKDIRQARLHMDISKDFPFGGHGTNLEDLESIRLVAIKNGMPPLLYALPRKNAELTADEKKAILMWVEKAKKLFYRNDEKKP